MIWNYQDGQSQLFSVDLSKEPKDEDYATDHWMLGSESEVCFDGLLEMNDELSSIIKARRDQLKEIYNFLDHAHMGGFKKYVKKCRKEICTKRLRNKRKNKKISNIAK